MGNIMQIINYEQKWLDVIKETFQLWKLKPSDFFTLIEKHKNDCFLLWVSCFYQDQKLWDYCIENNIKASNPTPAFFKSGKSIFNLFVKLGCHCFNDMNDEFAIKKLDEMVEFLLKQKVDWTEKVQEESHFCLLCTHLSCNPGWQVTFFPLHLFEKVIKKILHKDIHLFYNFGSYICSLTPNMTNIFLQMGRLQKKDLIKKDKFGKTGELILLSKLPQTRQFILELIKKEQWPYKEMGLLGRFKSNNHTAYDEDVFFKEFTQCFDLWPDGYIIQEDYLRNHAHLLKDGAPTENCIINKNNYSELDKMFGYYPKILQAWNTRVQKAKLRLTENITTNSIVREVL